MHDVLLASVFKIKLSPAFSAVALCSFSFTSSLPLASSSCCFSALYP